MECPSRRIVFGYRTAEEGGRSDSAGKWKASEKEMKLAEEQLLRENFRRWRSVRRERLCD